MVSRKEALLEVQKAEFALQEAALYLDAHPKNQNALDYFKYFQNLAYNARSRYEDNFGPLMFLNQGDSNDWEWVDGPWPWEGEA